MQLINTIASNATNGKIFLGLIPVSGILFRYSEPIKNRLGIKRNICPILYSSELALSILSTATFFPLPLTKEKKALFWIVSSLIISSPFHEKIVQRFGWSKDNADKAYNIGLCISLITKIWTTFMISVALGTRGNNISSCYAFTAINFIMLGNFHLTSFLKHLIGHGKQNAIQHFLI